MTKDDVKAKISGHLTAIDIRVKENVASLDESARQIAKEQLAQMVDTSYKIGDPIVCAEDIANRIEAPGTDWHQTWIMSAHVLSNFQPEKAADWPHAYMLRIYVEQFKIQRKIYYISANHYILLNTATERPEWGNDEWFPATELADRNKRLRSDGSVWRWVLYDNYSG